MLDGALEAALATCMEVAAQLRSVVRRRHAFALSASKYSCLRLLPCGALGGCNGMRVKP